VLDGAITVSNKLRDEARNIGAEGELEGADCEDCDQLAAGCDQNFVPLPLLPLAIGQ